MTSRPDDGAAIRREPPAFRRVLVDGIADLSPHLRRITFRGSELEGLAVAQPAASVRLLLPSRGEATVEIPAWNGNEVLLPDGTRPLIRTFTPRHLRTAPWELDIEIVLHGDAGASGWAANAAPGDVAAVSGTGRGYEIDPGSMPLVLLGDETAIPAIAQLIEWADVPVVAHVEVARRDARLNLPVQWHDLDPGEQIGSALVGAVAAMEIGDRTRIWAAGEAAAMQRIRKLLAARGVDRAKTTIRGYWKAGRAGPG